MQYIKCPLIQYNYARLAFSVCVLNYETFKILKNTHIPNSTNVTLFPEQTVAVTLELRVPFAPLFK